LENFCGITPNNVHFQKNDKKVKVTGKIVIFTKYIRKLGFIRCRTEVFVAKEE